MRPHYESLGLYERTISFGFAGEGGERVCQAAGCRTQDGHAPGASPAASGRGGSRGVRQRHHYAEARGEVLQGVSQHFRYGCLPHLFQPTARRFGSMRGGEHTRRDGGRGHAAVPRPVPRAGRGHLADGWYRAERLTDRQPRGTRPGRRRQGGDSGAEHDNGGRHDQLLHLPQAGEVWRQAVGHRARHFRGRRAGVCRRSDAGAEHREPHAVQRHPVRPCSACWAMT